MEICELCEEQSKRNRNGKPHEHLLKIDDLRFFTGKKPRGYEEQDYQCTSCQSAFTHSTDKNDLTWTLWRGQEAVHDPAVWPIFQLIFEQ